MIIKFNLSQLELVVQEHILPLLSTHSIFTFTGPLGAGKTTMIKVILRQCGITQPVTSPTFGYVNSYQAPDKVFNHFDLYRIASIDEFVSAGFDEYLHRPDNVCFIEWPQVIYELLKSPEMKPQVVHIKISYADDELDVRQLEVS